MTATHTLSELRGANDEIRPLDYAEQRHAGIRGASIVRLENGGHARLATNSSRVRAVATLLTREAGPGAWG